MAPESLSTSEADGAVGEATQPGGGDGGAGWSPRKAGCLGSAMIAAPFVGFAFGPDAGLVVAALALAVLAWFAFSAPVAEPVAKRRLRAAAVMNALLAVVCVAVLAVRLVGG